MCPDMCRIVTVLCLVLLGFKLASFQPFTFYAVVFSLLVFVVGEGLIPPPLFQGKHISVCVPLPSGWSF